MVAGLSKFGFVGSSVVPPLMMDAPVLALAAEAWTAPAAAIFEGSVNTTLSDAAAVAVGWTRNRSPAAGVPDKTIEMPSAVSGLPAVPTPVTGTLLPSLARVSE